MLLILFGSSDLAEATITNTIVKKRPQWRHVPPDEFAAILTQLGLDAEENEALAGMFFAECVRSLEADGYHVVQPASGTPAAVLQEMKGECTMVCVGGEPLSKGKYDHTIDVTGLSAGKIYEAMVPFLDRMEAA